MGRSKRFWIIAGVVITLAALAAGWFGRPAYRRYKEKRSMTQARAALKKGDYRTAVLALRQALKANSGNVEATRFMGDLATETQSPAALGWRRRAVELSPTFDHKILLASSALRLEKPPFPTAAQALEELRLAGAETNVAFHLVASQLAIRLNRPAEAEAHLEAVIKFDPTNRLHQLNLATIRLRSANTAAVSLARSELLSLTADPVLGEHALRSLISDALAGRQFDDAERLSSRLLAKPQARFEDRLQRLTILHEAQSDQLPQWLGEVKHAASTNVLRITVTAGWLNAHGQATNTIAWLTSLSPGVRGAPPLLAVEADAYVALRDWRGLEAFLNEQQWEDQEFLRLALLSRALREQGRRELASAHWRRAIAAAGTRVESLAGLAHVATMWGWSAETEDALWAIARKAPWLEWAWRGLLRARSEAGDTPGLYRVYSAELEAKPDSLPAKNNVAAIGLLLNRDAESSARLAREVFVAAPTNAAFASTYAFALHLQGKSGEAVKVMQTLPESALRQPEIAAYHAILLSAAGQREQATPYFAVAEKAALLPEERRLLEQARAAK